jgi:hypothetical protein
MPIRSYLDGHRFDPETVRLMGIAFEMALVALQRTDGVVNPTREAIAQKIIVLAEHGRGRRSVFVVFGITGKCRTPPARGKRRNPRINPMQSKTVSDFSQSFSLRASTLKFVDAAQSLRPCRDHV